MLLSASAGSFAASARRIAPLAWPVFIGQIAVLAFGTADTVLLARYAPLDLAALAVGGAACISVGGPRPRQDEAGEPGLRTAVAPSKRLR